MLALDDIRKKTPEEIHQLLIEQDALLAEKNIKIHQQHHEIDHLRFRVNKMLHERYGKRSETQTALHQSDLFDEQPIEEALSETEKNTSEKSQDSDITIPEHKRQKRGRPALPKDLPRVTRTYDLTEAEKRCGCGCLMDKIGEKTREQLEFIPAQVQVIDHVRYQYACRHCEAEMKLASMPKQAIPKSIASPGLLSHVLVSKFADHIPFYRQEGILNRMGVSLSRGSFCQWAQQCAELLQPMVESMQKIMIQHDVGYSDETRLQVLKEPGKKAESQSYMWLFIGGSKKERCFVYQYHSSRAHTIPKSFWSGFKGHLHTDGYSAYQTLFNDDNTPIKGLHCWAHLRRRFVDAAKQSKKSTLAHWAIKQIAELYKLEKQFKQQGYSAEQIYERRQKKSKPILHKIKKWLDEKTSSVPPKHPLGEAMQYGLKFWDNLVRYIDDGRFEIDNNRTERAIKPFVIGRKNWLFHESMQGAEAGAILYSLIETCKAHHLNAYLYLRYLLSEIPNSDKSEETYRSFLPFNIDQSKLWEFKLSTG